MKKACLRGHAYDDENTYIDKRGRRRCRACSRDAHAGKDYLEKRRKLERAQRNVRQGRHPREVLIMVSNAALREHLERSVQIGETTPTRLAFELGWTVKRKGHETGDDSRLKRTLGLLPTTGRNHRGERYSYFADRVEYEIGERLCLALHADPTAVGV